MRRRCTLKQLVKKTTYIFSLLTLLCAPSWAQSSNATSEVSPKLKKFLSDNPQVANLFTNAVSSASSNRTIQIFYFYSDNESEARSFHFYPNAAGLPEVMLCVRENQTPLDEFITVFFEIQNSKRENYFQNLEQEAYYGTISREQFAKEVLQNEFQATTNVRSTLLSLKLQTNDIVNSDYYQSFKECPTNFEGFLKFSKEASPDRDVMKEYESKYDSFRKMYPDANSPSNFAAQKN